ncbi:fimbrial protein [Erwinia tasmaniensis]|uniref:Major fimbrial subunit (Mannose-resistance fimbriae), MrfA protein n=1 Tax=Erwinia tasmaniensis (strain DSM 17950 / CFBP 7177 / CIP 109463 / NCPPB 4357 / Et1/99) TaxID=465817 RepID=B2VL20_ERWT9|nr:fimbrial protein [Erwinia tasmaniensis]CAO95451.1 Major fimbrial subunit (mannose-resistance fimbriae), MrfA protein [Erwinia tasmaniensis Et1/99]
MKLNKLSAVLGLGFVLASGAAFAADQGHGTVTFKGSIIDSPCSITPETANQTVDMGQISNKALQNTGKSTARPFYIKLENCDVSSLTNKTVTTTFTGTASKAQPKNLALVGQASGAALVITNGDGAAIDLGSASLPTSVQTGNNTLSYAAYLQGDSADVAVVPGDFSSVANFTLAYQ